MKKKYLVDDVDVVKKVLDENFGVPDFYPHKRKDTYVYKTEDAIYALEIYAKNLQGLFLLFLISDKEVTPIDELAFLKEVSDDVRYEKKYLKDFGNPLNYEFDVAEVFQKCDSVGLKRLDLHFTKGMSSISVFRVLLYRLNQLLRLKSEYDESLARDIANLYEISIKIFNKKAVKTLLKNLKNMQRKEEYFLDFDAFIRDETGFYRGKKADEVIYYFVRKSIYQNIQKANNATKKPTQEHYIQKIENLLHYFHMMFKEEEIEVIRLQIETFEIKE
jgi:hypothetical protein